MSDASIKKIILKGHSNEVTCLSNGKNLLGKRIKSAVAKAIEATTSSDDGNTAASSSSSASTASSIELNLIDCDNGHYYFMSGSEDRTARLWDVRTNRSCKAFISKEFGGISAVHFHYGLSQPSAFVASNQSIYQFDLRQDKILYNAYDSKIDLPGSVCEEINDLDSILLPEFANNGSNAAFVATIGNDKSKVTNAKPISMLMSVADDSGYVHILEFKEGSITNKFPNIDKVHSMMASSAKFKVHENNIRLISSGLDQKIMLSNYVHKDKSPELDYIRVNQTINVGAAPQNNSNGMPVMVNLPFAHSVTWAKNHNIAAAAIGDGTVMILSDESLKSNFKPKVPKQRFGSLIESSERFESHTSACASACFSPDDKYLITIGNDKYVKKWKVPKRLLHRNCLIKEDEEDDNAGGSGDEENPYKPLSAKQIKMRDREKKRKSLGKEEFEFGLVLNYLHPEKINSAISVGDGDGSIVIADTTKNLTILSR